MVKMIWANQREEIRSETNQGIVDRIQEDYLSRIYTLPGLVGDKVFAAAYPEWVSSDDEYLGVILPID